MGLAANDVLVVVPGGQHLTDHGLDDGGEALHSCLAKPAIVFGTQDGGGKSGGEGAIQVGVEPIASFLLCDVAKYRFKPLEYGFSALA